MAIHRFLCVVAQPAMQCELDFQKSAVEVWRVCSQEVAIMAIKDGVMVGTMGIIAPTWWYGNHKFMTDRWDFMLPDHWHGPLHKEMIEEARKIAATAGLKFIHQGKIRERNGFAMMMPRVLTPSE